MPEGFTLGADTDFIDDVLYSKLSTRMETVDLAIVHGERVFDTIAAAGFDDLEREDILEIHGSATDVPLAATSSCVGDVTGCVLYLVDGSSQDE